MNRYNVFEGDTPILTPTEECSIYFVGTGDVMERKMKAALAQVSQVEVFVDAFGEDFMRRATAQEAFRRAEV